MSTPGLKSLQGALPENGEPIQVSVDVPHSMNERLYAAIFPLANCTVVYASTAPERARPSDLQLGSAVYAIPAQGEVIRTALVNTERTIDFASTLAGLVARKTEKPAYAMCSVDFSNAVMGGSGEERMSTLQRLMAMLTPHISSTSQSK